MRLVGNQRYPDNDVVWTDAPTADPKADGPRRLAVLLSHLMDVLLEPAFLVLLAFVIAPICVKLAEKIFR
jgi:hypothetical protein